MITDALATGPRIAHRARRFVSAGLVLALASLVATCQVDKLLTSPDTGVLKVAPVTLRDSAALGSVAPRVSELELLPQGTTRLGWQAQSARGSAWIGLAAPAGTAPDTLVVSLDPTGLVIGMYRDTVVVSSSNSGADPLRIPVEFAVVACREDVITPDTLIGASLSDGDCASPLRTGHFAKRYRVSAVAGDSLSVELGTTGFDGAVRIDTVAASPAPTPYPPSLVEADQCPAGGSAACLHYFPIPGTREYVVEVTSSTAGGTGPFVLSVHRPRLPKAPDALSQRAADSTTVIAPGGSVGEPSVVLRAHVADADGVDTLRLEVELQPLGTPFAGAATAASDAGPVDRDVFVPVNGLGDETQYHWQARTVDQTGRASPWVAAGDNPETAPDFVVTVPEPPAAPSGMAQFKENGTTPIPLGGVTETRAAVFRATVTDPDPGDQLRLEIEARPIGTAFAFTPTASSAPVTSGSTATVTVAGLSDNTSYHWQARAIDQDGQASAWVRFGGNPETSTDFRVQVAAASLLFSVQPSNTTAGATMTPAVEVRALDAQGNTVTSFTGLVTLTIETGPVGATLSGVTTVNAVSGVATFSGLQLTKAGAGYTLRATAAGLTTVSGSFAVSPGAATRVAFLVEPVTTAAGAPITPAVQVAARDAFDNTVTSFTGAVTVTLAVNPGGGTLSGNPTRNAVTGIATFNDLSINATGTGYRLGASASGLAGAQSAAFDIIATSATRLAFWVEPVNTTAGAAITPAVRVRAIDALGNTVTTFTGGVTVALGANPGSAALAGTTSRTAVSGVATFDDLRIEKSGVGYTLVATAGGLAPDTSAAFNITHAPASKLAFTIQPANTVAGVAITPVVQVTAQDAFGNPATAFAGSVTLALGTNPPGNGVLEGTTTVTASAGVASFPGINIDQAGNGYTLAASAAGLTGATSTSFTIAAASATRLAFTVQPLSATAGIAITPPVQVAAQDVFGNTVTAYTGPVTVAIGTNPPGNGVLDGTPTVLAVAGVATFSALDIDEAGTGYTLVATSGILSQATSASFNITPGTVSAGVSLVAAAPTTITASNGASSSTVTVTVRDQFGNPISGVTVVLAATGSGNTLTQPAGPTNASGVATGTLSSTIAGTKTVSATAGGTALTQTATVTVEAAAATQLVFTVQPANTVAGATMSPIQVTARDGLGNTVTTFTGPVTVAIGTNPGGGVLTGTLNRSAVLGVATFNDLSINRSGVGYTLTAVAGGTGSATSTSFTITGGTASRLEFTVQPTSATAGTTLSPAVEVTAFDALNNVATGFTASIGVAIGLNPGAAALSGPTSVAAVAGVARFSALSLDKSGNGYTLTASAAGLATVPSTTFNITPGPTTQLAFTIEPTNAVAGANIAPAVQVTAQDALGNTTPSFTQIITITIGSNPGGATLAGNASIAAVAGVATFSNLSLDKSGTGYTLIAARAQLISDESAPFSITAASATQLAFTVHPSTAQAGAAITPAVQVTARDAFGNTATGFTGNVTVAIGTNPSGGTLSGIPTRAAVAGVANFTDLSINRTGTGYTLVATSGLLTQATSTAFTITAAPASVLVFTGQPTNATAGATITPAVQVTARDAFGNTATGFTGNVTVAIGSNPPGNGVLDGLTTVTAGAGVATFSTLDIDEVGTGYTMVATSGALTQATSASFNITTGTVSASLSTVVAAPATISASSGSTQSTITVTARDALGNPLAGATVVLAATGTGNSLTQPASPTSPGGVATGTLSSTVAEGKVVSATINGVAITQNVTVTVQAGAVSAAQSTVSAAPTTITASSGSSPSTITVTARDAFNNAIGGATVVLAATGTGNTVTQPAGPTNASGVATGTLSSTIAGTKTVSASVSGVAITQAASVTVQPAAASQLAFTGQPTSTFAGATITPAVQVTARDAFGNTATGFAGNVTLAIGINPPGNGVLDGTTTVPAAAGVATFSDLRIDEVGSGYTLVATSGALTQAISTAFNITAGSVSASLSTVAAAPATITASSGGSQSTITVTARDASGNPVSGATVVLAATGSGNTLTQPAGPTNASGVATGTVSSTVAETKIVSATIGGIGIIQNASITVQVGAVSAAQSTVSAAPTTITASNGSSPSTITVAARDAFNNPIAGATVVLAATGTGNTVTQPAGPTNASGVATGTLSSTGAGTKTVSATIGGVAITQTAIVTVQAAAVSAAQSSVSAAPTTISASSGTSQSTVTVTARDAFNNPVAGATVALAATGTGNTLTQPAGPTNASGVATGTLSSTAAEAKIVSATASGVAVTQTASVTVQAAAVSAAQSLVSAAPTTITASSGASQSTITVTARDGFNNPIAGATVALAATGAGNTLTQPASLTNASGVATGTLSSTGAGAKTVSTTINGVAVTQTAGVTVQASAASQLAFTGQPTNTAAGATITPAVQVTARDAFGNTATSFADNVALAIGTNPPGNGVLDGTTTVAALAGVATFADLRINELGSGYTLVATAGALTQATSTAFNITAGGGATQLVFTTQPTNIVAGVAISPAVQVTARDQLGNTATGFNGQVTIAIGANPAGGALLGASVVSAVGGVATFPDLSIDKAGTGYTLTASATGLSGATSATFNVTNAAPSALVFDVQPSQTVVNSVITPAVRVRVVDAFGNTVRSPRHDITVALANNPTGATLGGTTTQRTPMPNNQNAGVATFNNLTVNQVGTGYTLSAIVSNNPSITGTSTAFNIVAGTASQLAFTTQPVTTMSGQTITPAVQVTARDQFGNTATGFTGNVTLSIGTNPPGNGVLDGTPTVAAVAGVATFADLRIDEAGNGYTLVAASGALTQATSTAFDITALPAASASLSTITAATDTVGQCLSPCALGSGGSRITVTVYDLLGSPLSGATVTLSASADSNRFTSPGPSGVTNSSGVFQATFTSGQAALKTVSAVANGTPLSQTAAVAVMPVLVGAGDIADCTRTSDDATANQLDSIPGIVIPLGDNAYPNGRTQDFNSCYDPTWGRHKARTRPVVGNHEYDSSSTAQPHFDYFGSRAGPSGPVNEAGYYSYDVGTWHIVALNSEIAMSVGSPQEQWLRQDLVGRANQCVLAYWHKPRYSSGGGTEPLTQPLWQALYDAGAELVLVSHAHAYERFAPMNASGSIDVAQGIRHIIIGTGGGPLVSGFANPHPNSEVKNNTTHGVIRVTLYADSYRWEFMPAPGFGTFTDSGTGTCY